MNTSLCPEPEDDDRRWPDLLVATYPLVEEIVRFCRAPAPAERRTMRTSFGSLVRLGKLVGDD